MKIRQVGPEQTSIVSPFPMGNPPLSETRRIKAFVPPQLLTSAYHCPFSEACPPYPPCLEKLDDLIAR